MKKMYDILNVNETDSIETIRKSYIELSKIHHPDKGGEHLKFIEIREAYLNLVEIKVKESKVDENYPEKYLGTPTGNDPPEGTLAAINKKLIDNIVSLQKQEPKFKFTNKILLELLKKYLNRVSVYKDKTSIMKVLFVHVPISRIKNALIDLNRPTIGNKEELYNRLLGYEINFL